MLLLIVDTSGKQGSIALARGGPEDACKVIGVLPLTGGTFSAQLVPQIADLLHKSGFNKSDIDALVAITGPGSFTGLRVGLAAIKALAEVLAKPIAAVSLLEALAVAGHSQGRIMSVIDAGRKEVYMGEYEVGGSTRVISESLLLRDAWLERAGGAVVVTPDPDIATAVQEKGLRVVQVERSPIDAIARLGWKRIVSCETISAEDLEANYGRRSDAEIFVKSTT
jgi:tRNA threonylcarbamoyladenosine biosynthesis protein TsaB